MNKLVYQVGVLVLVDVNLVPCALPVRGKDDDGLGLDLLCDFPANLLQDRVGGVLCVILDGGLPGDGLVSVGCRALTGEATYASVAEEVDGRFGHWGGGRR